MKRAHLQENLSMVRLVVRRLGFLRERVVLVGGCATALLVTDPAAPDVRPTRDVDLIVEVLSRVEYYKLEEELRGLGFFQPGLEGDPICRWEIEGLKVDIMPTDRSILGFGNDWAQEALNNSVDLDLGEGLKVRVVTAPYLLGMKIDAFLGRGNGDYLASADMEDLVTVVDGRVELLEEIGKAPHGIKKHLSVGFNELLSDQDFLDSLPGHLATDQASQSRLPKLVERMNAISSLA